MNTYNPNLANTVGNFLITSCDTETLVMFGQMTDEVKAIPVSEDTPVPV